MDKIRGKYGADAIFRGGAADAGRIGRKYKAQLEEDQNGET